MKRIGYLLLGFALALSGGAAALQGIDLSDTNTGVIGRSDFLAHGRGNGGYAAARYYTGEAMNASNGATTGAVAANTLYVMPFLVQQKRTWTKIGINVTVLAGTNARLGIYNFANGVPTTLVLDAGTISTATTGQKEATISQILEVGAYALVVVFDNTPTVTMGTLSTTIGAGMIGAGSFGTIDTQQTATFTFGALPASFSAGGVGALTYTAANTPIIWMRI